MSDYEVVANSRGPRREFRITVGLREGYDPEGRVYDLSEASKIALRWMTDRAAAGKPFLSGMFTRGEVAYAWRNEDGGVGRDREPVAIFTGEAIPLYAGDLDTAALFLEQLIQNAPDEYTRAEYLKAHDEIETERRARLLDQLRAVFVQRNHRDLREPAELWAGPLRLMRKMPPPHPHFEGFEWVLDAESGRIVSSFYGARYQLHVHPLDQLEREAWRAEEQQSANAAVEEQP